METPASTPTETRQLILSLIKDDLVNSKLINNLNDIGIDASNYSLNIRSAIFQLMGFGAVSDAMHDSYTDFTLRAKDIDFLDEPQQLDQLAVEIFDAFEAQGVHSPPFAPCSLSRTVVVGLIKQDLINYKMIHRLANIQISADNYSLDICRIIFEVMNIENREDIDTIFETYVELSKPVLAMHPSQSNPEIDQLASGIYDYLEKCTRQ